MTPDWHDDAACRGMDVSLFFPTVGRYQVAQRAQRICERCPVREECLADALATGTQHGVWGGTTPRQRRNLRRLRTAPTAA